MEKVISAIVKKYFKGVVKGTAPLIHKNSIEIEDAEYIINFTYKRVNFFLYTTHEYVFKIYDNKNSLKMNIEMLNDILYEDSIHVSQKTDANTITYLFEKVMV